MVRTSVWKKVWSADAGIPWLCKYFEGMQWLGECCNHWVNVICRGQPVVNYNSKSLDRVDTRNAMPPRMTKACQLTKIVFPVGLAVPGGLKSCISSYYYLFTDWYCSTVVLHSTGWTWIKVYLCFDAGNNDIQIVNTVLIRCQSLVFDDFLDCFQSV